MAILDDIKRRLAKTKTPDITGTQGQLQNVLQAKTGKVATHAGPKASSVGEQAVQSELEQQAQQQQLQGVMAGQQLQQQQDAATSQQDLQEQQLTSQRRMAESEMAQQSVLAREGISGQAERSRMQRNAQEEMKTSAINNAFQEAVTSLASQNNIQQDNLFQNFRQSNDELDFRKDASQLEQLAFNMAMSDKEYLDELSAIGKMRQLENNLTFKEDYAKMVHGEETSQLIDQLGWKEAFNADEREFQSQMASMNIDQAIAMANASIKDSNNRALASGIIQGTQAYSQAKTGE